MLGMDMLVPELYSSDIDRLPLCVAELDNELVLPCLSSPVLFSSAMVTLPTVCVATSFSFSVLVDSPPQPVRQKRKTTSSKQPTASSWSISLE